MLKSKKLKTLTAILATALFVSGTNLIPTYAKGLSKAVKEEYVKILKEDYYYDGYSIENLTRFRIVDINNDGKDDLITETNTKVYGRSSEVYLNFGNKVKKAKIKDKYGVERLGQLGEISLYKNYVMNWNSKWINREIFDYYDTIYKVDKKGKFKVAYVHDSLLDKFGDEESEYFKSVNGELEEISKKEYKKFASKFKEVKGKCYDWTLENIEKYVK